MPFITGFGTGGGGGGGNVNAPSPPLVLDNIVVGLGGTDIKTVPILGSTTAVNAPAAAVIINSSTPSVVVGFNSAVTTTGVINDLIIYGYNNLTQLSGGSSINNFLMVGHDLANQNSTAQVENVIFIGSGINTVNNILENSIIIGHNIFSSGVSDDVFNAVIIGSGTGTNLLEIEDCVIIGADSFTSAVIANTFNTCVGASSGNTLNGGDRNLLLGHQVDVTTANAQNEINIVNTIFGNSSSKHLRIGGLLATPLTGGAALEISSTNGALLLPRLTTTQRDALTPVAGMEIWNTTDVEIQAYNGTSWVGAGGGGPFLPLAGGALTGPVTSTSTWNNLDIQSIASTKLTYNSDNNTVLGLGVFSGTAPTNPPIDNVIIGNDILDNYGDILFNKDSVMIGKNIARGSGAYRESVFIGSSCMSSNGATQGSVNIGFENFNSLTLGDFNTGIGWASASNLVTGSFNVFMGTSLGASLTNGSGNTIIADNGIPNATNISNCIILGKTSGGSPLDTPTTTTNSWLNIGATIYGDLTTQHVRIGGTQSTLLNGSAALEINSTDGALVLPRLTTTQRDALTPVAGSQIWNITTTQLEVWDGAAWQSSIDTNNLFIGSSPPGDTSLAFLDTGTATIYSFNGAATAAGGSGWLSEEHSVVANFSGNLAAGAAAFLYFGQTAPSVSVGQITNGWHTNREILLTTYAWSSNSTSILRTFEVYNTTSTAHNFSVSTGSGTGTFTILPDLLVTPNNSIGLNYLSGAAAFIDGVFTIYYRYQF